MKVYFSASVSARVYNDDNDRKIVEYLEKLFGNNVYSKHIFGNVIEKGLEKKGLSISKIREESYNEIIDHINKADLVVAEISYPSISVGHEISYALSKQKQVILLHLPNKSSRLLEGIRDSNLHIVEYTSTNLIEVLSRLSVEIKKNMSVRFNFFLPKNLLAKLEMVAGRKGVNKSEFIRGLIEKDMRKRRLGTEQVRI